MKCKYETKHPELVMPDDTKIKIADGTVHTFGELMEDIILKNYNYVQNYLKKKVKK